MPSVLLQPQLQWADKADFNDTLAQLATLFVGSFRSYLEDAAAHVGADMAERILSGGPDMRQIEALAAAAAATPHHHTDVHGGTAAPAEGGGDSDVGEDEASHADCKACAARKVSAEAPAGTL